ncbi:hypothetical protein PAECIP111893_00793 [Paenibacillus plantiphilus]|uniref:Uncharacterized protein n=1 Tax=Paenibacillus plantiphilus TaxID=2905650 RepID=A0ABN8G0D3_9BACL|nr:hypothetical protein [Paenibacillus plantiphilus]CAH1196006.1 hypothetical protein PAECIP111893_00793 [Paenibacillus plantiphilus]
MKAKIMILLALAFCMLLPNMAAAHPRAEGTTLPKPVQAFDVAAGKVVKTVPNSKQYQDYARSWLASVTGLSPQVEANEKCGYVYRIPLTETASVKTTGLNVQVTDVFLFYCPNKPALLLIFDENRKPYLLQFKADIQPFLKTIAIP